MLILFARGRQPAAPRKETQRLPRCDFFIHVEAYIARQIEPAACAAFETHLMECGLCQRSVSLGRVANRSIQHNRSVGTPCAAPIRRKS